MSISSGPASLLDRTDVFFFLESTGLNFLFFLKRAVLDILLKFGQNFYLLFREREVRICL